VGAVLCLQVIEPDGTYWKAEGLSPEELLDFVKSKLDSDDPPDITWVGVYLDGGRVDAHKRAE